MSNKDKLNQLEQFVEMAILLLRATGFETNLTEILTDKTLNDRMKKHLKELAE